MQRGKYRVGRVVRTEYSTMFPAWEELAPGPKLKPQAPSTKVLMVLFSGAACTSECDRANDRSRCAARLDQCTCSRAGCGTIILSVILSVSVSVSSVSVSSVSINARFQVVCIIDRVQGHRSHRFPHTPPISSEFCLLIPRTCGEGV